jgi:hypothetical protein
MFYVYDLFLSTSTVVSVAYQMQNAVVIQFLKSIASFGSIKMHFSFYLMDMHVCAPILFYVVMTY